MTWHYNGEEITTEIYEKYKNEGYIGFIYLLTNKEDNMKYVGKKLWVTTRKLPPLKGKKRKRIKVVETDWRSYVGSSKETQLLAETKGLDIFHREILILCKSKGELSYREAQWQFAHDVLLKPKEFHNGIIQCRINRIHVTSLMDV